MNQTPDETSSAVKAEIMRKYEKFAPWYDLVEGILEFLGVKNLRHRLLRRASGKGAGDRRRNGEESPILL